MKREWMPKSWPLARKGTTYVVKPKHSLDKGVPLLVALRDMLHVAATRNEVKKALVKGDVLLNGKPAREDKNTILLFDIITFTPSKKNYKLTLLKRGKFGLEEIKESEANRKIAKIIGKRLFKHNKMQISLSDGRNFLVSREFNCKVDDSAVVDFKNQKIEKCLGLKEKSEVIVLQGIHAGQRYIVNKLDKEENSVEVETEDKKKIKISVKYVMALS